MSAISIQLPQDLDTRLAALSATTGRGKSDHRLEAIQEHLDDLEDFTSRSTASPICGPDAAGPTP